MAGQPDSMRIFSPIILALLYFVSVTNALPNLARTFISQSLLTFDNLFKIDFVPSGFDFWRSAKELGQKAVDNANKDLNEAISKYGDVANEIHDFKTAVINLGVSAEAFRLQSQESFQVTNFDTEEFTRRLLAEIETILEDLKAEFILPLPEDQTERYKRREQIVSQALDKIEGALVKVYRMFSVPELEVREKFSHVKPHIKHVILVTGQLVDNHPQLATTLLVAGVIILVPEGWILKPVLRAFGFGPQGPVKGSAAAWAQRFFYRTAIEEGSWFARLQSAGMKWPGNIKVPIGIGAGIGAGIIGSIKAGCL